jgi:hypothetical protein
MKKLIYLCLALIMVSACKKDSDNETPAPTPTPTGNTNTGGITVNSVSQVSVKIDGVPFAKVVDGTNVEEVNSSYSAVNPMPDTSRGRYASSLSNPITSEMYIEVGKGEIVMQGWGPSDATFKAFFNPGSYSYSTTWLNGVYIMMEIGGVEYSTLNPGSQAGSTFTITDRLEFTGGLYSVKVKITFNCKLYNASGGVKTVTEGTYIGYFQNM